MENGFRFPLFVDLSGQCVVVVGGGAIACRRIGVLLDFGAQVTVIAPILDQYAESVRWERRPYAPGDLAGAVLAVAATDDRIVNHAVGEEAAALTVPVSIADNREECTFFFPAICKGKNVVAGVISRGGDHAETVRAAKAVRRAWEELD